MVNNHHDPSLVSHDISGAENDDDEHNNRAKSDHDIFAY